MENQEIKQPEESYKNWERVHRRGRAFTGVLIVIIGSLFLARELGAELPPWLFSWKMLLIGLGLVIGIKHRFQNPGWIILILVGGTFLLSDIYPGLVVKPLLWPIIIICMGLFLIFKPHRKNRWKHQQNCQYREKYKEKYKHYYKDNQDYEESTTQAQTSNESVIDTVTVMGSVKKNIVSKDFKGGEMHIVFGGAELNLTQADFNGTITLEITQVFGGTRLIIPAHWQIKSELVCVFGSVEDKRPVQPTSTDSEKVLILQGNTFFGGIEIKSY